MELPNIFDGLVEYLQKEIRVCSFREQHASTMYEEEYHRGRVALAKTTLKKVQAIKKKLLADLSEYAASQAGAALGSVRSKAKAASSRENGKKGGRPPKAGK